MVIVFFTSIYAKVQFYFKIQSLKLFKMLFFISVPDKESRVRRVLRDCR